jgi:ubiquinone biosynthesis UbiH/UbiF/VisC/COQ6 family hydroxylase
MSMRREFDLLVAGSGIVGLSFALAAARSGWRVALLDDAAPEPNPRPPHDARAYALAPRSIQWLDALGVWPRMADQAQPYRQMRVWDSADGPTLKFDAATLGKSALGAIVADRDLRAALRAAIAQTPTVIVATHARPDALEIDAQRVRLEIGETRLRARLLVVADGAQSPYRQLLGVTQTTLDHAQTALVCCVRSEQPHAATAWQRFNLGGPSALLPLKGDAHLSALVWTLPPERAASLEAAADAVFEEALTRAFDGRLGALRKVGAVRRFPLRSALADRWIGPSFALIGDSARSVHPLAGLGLNLGLSDARELLEHLDALKQAGRDPFTLAALRPYERSRRSESAIVVAALSAINSATRSASAPLQSLRALGMRSVTQSPWLQRLFAERALALKFGLERAD